MHRISLLQNSIQGYAWGSKTAIAELLGQPAPTKEPQAELWMGAHQKLPSRVFCDGVWRSLLEVLQDNPEEMLGRETAQKYGNRLPFLFKVLAPARPLSIQAHPNEEQAKRGFSREHTSGIPLDAPQRNYRDDSHKPEIICALTPFWAFNGFRRIPETLELFEKIRVPSLAPGISLLRDRPDQEGLKVFFRSLLAMEGSAQQKAVSEAVASAKAQGEGDPLWNWIISLNQEHPGNLGVLVAVLLNLVRLEPGQAMYLPAGELHAYLEGVGIELMANSDNVLRGGLTSKHVDIPELLRVLNFTDKEVDVLSPKILAPGEAVYPTPAEEFMLSVIAVRPTSAFHSAQNRSIEIMICTEGEARVRELRGERVTEVSQGTSFVVPAAVEQYRIEGDATLYKATVPR